MLESNSAAGVGTTAEASLVDAECSVVEAVLWACELSEDETEVSDLVGAALGCLDTRVARDPAAVGDGPDSPLERLL